MNVLIFGATGMVGQGVLLACIASNAVQSITVIGRSAPAQKHPKLHTIVHENMWDYAPVEAQLSGFDACYFCLGVSSAGLTELAYTHLTYDLTLAAANTLAQLNPNLTLVYVSGVGTDSTEHGNTMWARVKGRTENALLNLPIKRAYMFRPGAIQALDGIRSKTRSYQLLYSISKPILSILRALFPNYIATMRTVAQAMIRVSIQGYSASIVDSSDIEILAAIE